MLALPDHGKALQGISLGARHRYPNWFKQLRECVGPCNRKVQRYGGLQAQLVPAVDNVTRAVFLLLCGSFTFRMYSPVVVR